VINIPELDRYDEWLRTETEAKLDERLVLALNSDLHSPLTLAAAVICRHESDDTREKRILMFQHLLQYNKTPLWTYGAIKVSRIKLEGIEIKYKLERYQHIPLERFHQPHHAAIDWLCINDADPRVIQIPEIKSFIETKWERCGYPSFLVRFLVHTGITILITLIMLFPNVTPRFVDVTPEVVVVDVLYPIVGATFAWIMVCEVQDFMKYGRYFWALRGVARYDKVVRCVKVASFLIFAAYKIAAMNNGMEPVVDGKVIVSDATDHALKVSLTICVMSSWLHVYYFLMGFESTGPFMLTIFRIVGRNVPYFMRFYAVVVVTFACGLSLLSNNGTLQPGYAFMNLLTAVWTLLQVTVGADPTHNSIDIHSHVPAHLYWLADLLLTTYYASVVILMINLLIAMIGHTYEEYISYNSALLLIEKYNIMHAVERSMCAIEYEYYRSLYSHRVKVTIDSLVVSNSHKQNSLSRAVSGFASIRNSTKGSARGNGEFAKHVTVEHSNYDFELQEVNDMWFSDAEAHQDAARSKAASKAPPQIILFLICPQNDYYPGGAMAVENAAPSAKHLETLIREHGSRIKQIVIALATHQYGDLTHPSSWESYQGERPTAGTKITYKALLEGDWQARNAILQEWYELYAKRLESEHRRSLTILPEHCIIGTRGHSVHQSINSAVQEWAARSKNTVQYVHFGSNKRAYMYSAMQAAVEDPLDASTALNTKLLNVLLESDQVTISTTLCSSYVRVQYFMHLLRGSAYRFLSFNIVFCMRVAWAGAAVRAGPEPQREGHGAELADARRAQRVQVRGPARRYVRWCV
jgi:nicotinamidase-related amidase